MVRFHVVQCIFDVWLILPNARNVINIVFYCLVCVVTMLFSHDLFRAVVTLAYNQIETEPQCIKNQAYVITCECVCCVCVCVCVCVYYDHVLFTIFPLFNTFQALKATLTCCHVQTEMSQH